MARKPTSPKKRGPHGPHRTLRRRDTSDGLRLEAIVEDSVFTQVQGEAVRLQTTRSEIVREALDRYFGNKERPKLERRRIGKLPFCKGTKVFVVRGDDLGERKGSVVSIEDENGPNPVVTVEIMGSRELVRVGAECVRRQQRKR